MEQIVAYFKEVPDFRVAGRCEHYLCDILTISVCAVVCGADDFEEIAEYGQSKEDFFRSFLTLPNGIPSHDTFNRIFRYLDHASFNDCLRRYTTPIIEQLRAAQINIDGKVLRATRKRGKANSGICLISAWSGEHHLSLGQRAVEAKSNEKTAIIPLLNEIDLHGKLVTIDSMGGHTKFAEAIVERGGDYLLAIKENEANLYEQLHDWIEAHRRVADVAVQTDLVGGRIEQRTAYVCRQLDLLDELSDWPGAARVIMVESQRSFKQGPKNEPETQRRFYVSSKAEGAAFFNHAVRRHWSIENELHWFLDVVFLEDRQRVRLDNGPLNMSALRKTALHLLSTNRPPRDSIKKRRKRAGWKEEFLIEILQPIAQPI